MSKILCPEPGSQLTIGSTTVPITPAPAEPVGGTPRTDTLAKDERHLTVAETRYWCDQYKTLARQLERELGEANIKIQSAWDSYRTAFDNYAKAEREVAGLRAALQEIKKECAASIEYRNIYIGTVQEHVTAIADAASSGGKD